MRHLVGPKRPIVVEPRQIVIHDQARMNKLLKRGQLWFFIAPLGEKGVVVDTTHYALHLTTDRMKSS